MADEPSRPTDESAPTEEGSADADDDPKEAGEPPTGSGSTDPTGGDGPDAASGDDGEVQAGESAPVDDEEGPESGDASGGGAGSKPGADAGSGPEEGRPGVPEDVRKYERFKKVDDARYERVNEFLRDRTYVTAREWAIARLCADFRTETGVEMTKIGENLPELVPFMEDTYTPQAVNQARASFEEKVRKSGATFLYGAMSGFLTAEELDELMYEVTEVAKFLLEVEGVELTAEEELAAEDRVSEVMREVREASEALRHDECPHCGEPLE